MTSLAKTLTNQYFLLCRGFGWKLRLLTRQTLVGLSLKKQANFLTKEKRISTLLMENCRPGFPGWFPSWSSNSCKSRKMWTNWHIFRVALSLTARLAANICRLATRLLHDCSEYFCTVLVTQPTKRRNGLHTHSHTDTHTQKRGVLLTIWHTQTVFLRKGPCFLAAHTHTHAHTVWICVCVSI